MASALAYTYAQMKKLMQDERGFVTMIVMIVLVLAAVIGLAYLRVANAGK